MGNISIWLRTYWRSLVIIGTPLIFAAIPIAVHHVAARCGYVILVAATFWVTEVVPLPVTSLIPVFALPLLGVLSTSEVCAMFMTETNMMFIGGLSVAIAVEHCKLHQRVALFVILHVGQSPRRLMAGFMMTTMFLSMWISNTASTAMMIPVVEAIIIELQLNRRKEEIFRPLFDPPEQETSLQDKSDAPSAKKEEATKVSEASTKIPVKEEIKEDHSSGEVVLDKEHRALRDMCFLATAFSANVGGTGSMTGTGPNMIMKSILDTTFSEPTEINFATWMAFNVPGMIVCVFLAWIWLQVLYMGLGRKSRTVQKMSPDTVAAIRRLVQKKYQDLGPVTHHEKTVTGLFIVLVVLWFFRSPEFVPGWAGAVTGNFENKIKIGGATPAMAIAFLLFVLPSKPRYWWHRIPEEYDVHEEVPACMTWKVLNAKMPWNLMLLLGGGFALAKGATSSGLSSWLGEQLVALQVLPREVIVLTVCLMTAMATEVASNSVTASILMPVLLEMSRSIGVNPLYLMLPAAVCCSYAFMLPVATPPNAIAFNAAKMKNTDMMKAGFVMNILSVLVITVMINAIGIPMFDLNNMPKWINSTVV